MPANDPSTILLSGLEWPIRREAPGSGVITPGMLLEYGALGVVLAHNSAGAANQKVFARRAISNTAPQGGGIDVDYIDGDTIQVGYGRPGDRVNAILNAGTAIAINDNLISDGIGGVKTAAAETAEVFVGRAVAAVSDPSSGIARVEVELF